MISVAISNEAYLRFLCTQFVVGSKSNYESTAEHNTKYVHFHSSPANPFSDHCFHVFNRLGSSCIELTIYHSNQRETLVSWSISWIKLFEPSCHNGQRWSPTASVGSIGHTALDPGRWSFGDHLAQHLGPWIRLHCWWVTLIWMWFKYNQHFLPSVGAGSAGAVVANRLSEDPGTKVLLLEAGGSENIFSDIPLAAATLQMTPIDWAYQTEPQEASCFGFVNRVSYNEPSV